MTDSTSAVTVKFRLTSSEVFSALARHNLRKMWFLPLLFLILGAISIVWAASGTASAPNLSSACSIFVWSALLFGGLPYLQTHTAMKNPNLHGPITLTVQERGMEANAEHCNSTIAWTMVKGVSETGRAILIHVKPVGFQIVPKRQLNSTDLAAFKNALRLWAPGKVKLKP